MGLHQHTFARRTSLRLACAALASFLPLGSTLTAHAVVAADRPVRLSEARWVAGIEQYDTYTQAWMTVCTGVLVSPDTVLTAAHCVADNPDVDTWKVRIGTQKHRVGGQLIDVVAAVFNSDYIVDPAYETETPVTEPLPFLAPDAASDDNDEAIPSGGSASSGKYAEGEDGDGEDGDIDSTIYDDDIAMLKLAHRVTGIRPVALPTSTYTPKDGWRIYGWGQISSLNTDNATTLQTAGVDDWTPELFASSEAPLGNVIGAVRVDGEIVRGVCYGDSGGPLVDGRNILIGLTSFAFTQFCEDPVPTAFTKVSSYLDWIAGATAYLAALPSTGRAGSTKSLRHRVLITTR